MVVHRVLWLGFAIGVCAACGSTSDDSSNAGAGAPSQGGNVAAGSGNIGGTSGRGGSVSTLAGGGSLTSAGEGGAVEPPGGASGAGTGGAANGGRAGDDQGGTNDASAGEGGEAGALNGDDLGAPLPPANSDYLLYSAYSNLYLLDPLSPSQLTLFSDHIGAVQSLPEGTYDATTQTVTNRHWHRFISFSYGHFMLTTLERGKAPVTRQISNEYILPLNEPEPTIDDLCAVTVVPDWANPDNTRIFYAISGADKQCSIDSSQSVLEASVTTDIIRTVRVGDDETTPPQPVQDRLLTELRDTSGAISGWLELPALFCYAESGCNPTPVARVDANLGQPQLIGPDWYGGWPIARALDGRPIFAFSSGDPIEIRVYDDATRTLGPALVSLSVATALGQSVADAQYLYLSLTSPEFPAGIYRLPLTARDTDEPELVALTDGELQQLNQTDHDLFFVSLAKKLMRLPKDPSLATSPELIAQSQDSQALGFQILGGAGSHLFVQDANGIAGRALVFSEQGTLEKEYDNGAWLGYQAPDRLSLVTSEPMQTALLLFDGEVQAVNATAPTRMLDLGAPGAAFLSGLPLTALGFRRELLFDAGKLVFADIGRAGSLTVVSYP